MSCCGRLTVKLSPQGWGELSWWQAGMLLCAPRASGLPGQATRRRHQYNTQCRAGVLEDLCQHAPAEHIGVHREPLQEGSHFSVM